jgi:hypothetical protein
MADQWQSSAFSGHVSFFQDDHLASPRDALPQSLAELRATVP